MSDDPPKKRDEFDVALQWADFCPDDPLAGPAVPIGKGWLIVAGNFVRASYVGDDGSSAGSRVARVISTRDGAEGEVKLNWYLPPSEIRAYGKVVAPVSRGYKYVAGMEELVQTNSTSLKHCSNIHDFAVVFH